MNFEDRNPVAWTIAGSDSGGGVGIQADLHTFQDFQVHGCTVVTALTAQNSFALGYTIATERKNVVAQINALDSDLPADAIKLGMLANGEIIETVAKYLADYKGPVICNPVMAARSGDRLLDDEAIASLKNSLMPVVDLLMPNIPEAEALLGKTIASFDDMAVAAEQLLALGVKAVLLTGGTLKAVDGKRVDYWTDGTQHYWLAAENIDTVHNHGSDCALSSAIAAALALGYTLLDSIILAKAYVAEGLRKAHQLGGGPGCVAHCGWPSRWQNLPQLSSSVDQALAASFEAGKQSEFYPEPGSTSWLDKLDSLGMKA